MHALALPMVFVLSLAPTGTSARFQFDAEGSFTHVSAIDGPVAHGRTVGGGVQLGLTLFGRRVVDDDSPVTLQPFLQRVSSFRLVGGGGGSQYAEPNGAVSDSSYGGSVTASARIHVHRNFVLDASFGVGRRLSITGELHGGLARFASDRSFEEWVGGEVGVLFWTRRLVGLGLHYAPAWQHSLNRAIGIDGVPLNPVTQFVTHFLSFTVSSRLWPRRDMHGLHG